MMKARGVVIMVVWVGGGELEGIKVGVKCGRETSNESQRRRLPKSRSTVPFNERPQLSRTSVIIKL